MRLANHAGRAVLVAQDGIIDLERASGGRFGSDMSDAIAEWRQIQEWEQKANPLPAQPLDPELLQAPSPRPRQVFAIGLNYADHADEAGYELPQTPPTFTKFPTCITGPGTEVRLVGDRVDWEIEMVLVIGCRAFAASEHDAWSHVAGVTAGQDLSARDVQLEGPSPQFSLGKSFPGFGPTGPWLVTPDDLEDREDLELGCLLNGEPMQQARTSQMLFAVPELIARLSTVCPLLPGDLIFTGTPSGVGNRRSPQRFLRPGDVLNSQLEGVGSFETRFVASTIPQAPTKKGGQQ